MATYKVIQDIEAEDKLVGPLSLKQFIFATIAAGFIFAGYFMASQTGIIYLAIPFIPFVIVFGVLAAPFGKDQPTEVWLAAKLRFLIKPKVRIWDQSGLKELVTITVPKKEYKQLINDISQTEVKSRLEALANTLDSRGWVAKHVQANMYANPALAFNFDNGNSNRLISPMSLAQNVIDTDVSLEDDIMDVSNNQKAQQFDRMVQQSADDIRSQAIANMRAAASRPVASNLPQDNPISDDKSIDEETSKEDLIESPNTPLPSAIISPANPEEKSASQIALEEEARQKVEAAEKSIADKRLKSMTSQKNTGNIELAQSDDLSVASISNLANRKNQNTENEVVINLH